MSNRVSLQLAYLANRGTFAQPPRPRHVHDKGLYEDSMMAPYPSLP